jgi:maltose alpha-D-glucosyltransferase/alpha-amylase
VRPERPEAIPVPAEPPLVLTERDPPALVVELLGGYLETARLLGTRIAELHCALASDHDDPAFAPELLTPFYQRGLYQSLRNLIGQSFRRLRAALATLPADVGPDAARLAKLEPQVLEVTRGLIRAPLSGARIRIHGDLHLGQVLRTGSDFIVIDFEGEPMASLGERRLKRLPLRDVAGMLRSFDYAAHAATRDAHERGIAHGDDLPALLRWAAFWRAWTSSAFLRAYLQRMEGAGLLPRTRPEVTALLRIMLIEKSVYELDYELNMRPGWAGIPIRGILDQLGPSDG